MIQASFIKTRINKNILEVVYIWYRKQNEKCLFIISELNYIERRVSTNEGRDASSI